MQQVSNPFGKRHTVIINDHSCVRGPIHARTSRRSVFVAIACVALLLLQIISVSSLIVVVGIVGVVPVITIMIQTLIIVVVLIAALRHSANWYPITTTVPTITNIFPAATAPDHVHAHSWYIN